MWSHGNVWSPAGKATRARSNDVADWLVCERPLPWIAATQQACPALPASWVAAIIAGESAFHPDAHAKADLHHNGVWDVQDPLIHARVAGSYLRSASTASTRPGPRTPIGASTRQLTDLEALALAHQCQRGDTPHPDGSRGLEGWPLSPRPTDQEG